VAEMEKSRIEGRKVYLDLLEATLAKKSQNRRRKEERKAKVRQAIGAVSCMSSLAVSVTQSM